MSKIKTLDMEIAVSKYLNYRKNLVIPNVSWGMFMYELDLFMLTPSGYGTEVEIKVSKADLIKDKSKSHGHRNSMIKYLYFAIPWYLKKDIEHIPARAGILIVLDTGRCYKLRNAECNNCYKFTDKQRNKLLELMAMRIWRLKQKLAKLS